MWNITECLLALFFTRFFLMLLVFVSGGIFSPRVVTLAVVPLVAPVPCFPALVLSCVVSCERKIEKRTNCFRVIVLSIILIQTLAAGWLLFAVLWYPVHRRCFFIDNLVNPETERAREKNWRLFPPFPTPNSLRLRSINPSRILFSDARSTIPKNKIQGQLTGHSLKVKVICSIWPLSTDTIWHHFRSRPSCEPYTE